MAAEAADVNNPFAEALRKHVWLFAFRLPRDDSVNGSIGEINPRYWQGGQFCDFRLQDICCIDGIFASHYDQRRFALTGLQALSNCRCDERQNVCADGGGNDVRLTNCFSKSVLLESRI